MNHSQGAPATPTTPTAPAPTTTFALEDSLPRVPLPSLEESCARFLAWCSPLLTAGELAETEAEVAAFLRPDGPGRVLQSALEEYDATKGVHSWLDTFWPYRYLGRRDRIALNANFFFLFQDTGRPQLERAAGLIAAALNHKHQLDRELIPPVVQRGRPQSMEQNKFLFSTTRIPGAQQDTVRAPYTEDWPSPSDARHIVVFFRGGMVKLDVLGPDGVPHSLDELEAGLRAVVEAGTGAPPPGADAPVGHLTTMARAEWAAARDALLAHHPANAAALDDVETALFCVCLEDFAPADTQQTCDELLYGDRGNRWFDKAVSFVVFADGRAGINVEHCELDGTTILSFVDALLTTPAEEHSRLSGARPQGPPALSPLTFHLDDALRDQVHSAAAAFAQYGADTATRTVAFDDFGATTAKSLGVSPDAFVQLAYQLAHQRAKDTWAPPTSRSPPGSGGAAAPRRCASSPRRSWRSWPPWRTRRPTRKPAAPPFVPPPRRTSPAPSSARPATPPNSTCGNSNSSSAAAARNSASPNSPPSTAAPAGSPCATTT